MAAVMIFALQSRDGIWEACLVRTGFPANGMQGMQSDILIKMVSSEPNRVAYFIRKPERGFGCAFYQHH